MVGGSRQWLKSLIKPKKSQSNISESGSGRGGRRWKLWKSSKGSSSSNVAPSEMSDASYLTGNANGDDAYAMAVAAVTRAPHKDFMAVRREWAAVRIQTAFRGFLARRAFRALRALVRIQAIFRGRMVRKQAAVTLRCMQALVRVQARVRARSSALSPPDNQQLVNEQRLSSHTDPKCFYEKGWCDRSGSVDEVRSKLQMRRTGAIKRERAITYHFAQQQPLSRSNGSPDTRLKKSANVLRQHQKTDKNESLDWNWLDRWMASKPWESRLMEEMCGAASDTKTFSRASADHIPKEIDCVSIRRSNMTTRVSAKPPVTSQVTHACSDPSGYLYDEGSASSSSMSATPSPVLRKSFTDSRGNSRKPSYMNPTESIKAKQRYSRCSKIQQTQLVDDSGLCKKFTSVSNGDLRSCSGSEPSCSNITKDLYPIE